MFAPVDPTRRHFLSQAAGAAAAGGAVLALATMPAATAAGMPMAALTAPPALAQGVAEPDLIFAAIERYKAATEADDAAEADFARREKILLETVGQREPSISVINLSGNPRGPGYGQQVTAYSHEQIDALCPPDKFPDMNRLQRAFFDDLARRHADIMGDAERVRQATAGPAYDALADLVETVPTTLAGILALLDWQRESIDADSQSLHVGHLAMVGDAIGDALRSLNGLAPAMA